MLALYAAHIAIRSLAGVRDCTTASACTPAALKTSAIEEEKKKEGWGVGGGGKA